MNQSYLVCRFASKGFLLNQDAVAYLQRHDFNDVLKLFTETSPETLVITLPDIQRVLRIDRSSVVSINVDDFTGGVFWNRYDDPERQSQKNLLRIFGIVTEPESEPTSNRPALIPVMTTITVLKLESRASELKQAGESERSIASILSLESNQKITQSSVHRYLTQPHSESNTNTDIAITAIPATQSTPVLIHIAESAPVASERACGICNQPLCGEPYEVVGNRLGDVHTRCKNVIVRVRALRNVDYISPVTRAHVRMIEGQSYDIPAFQAVEDIRLRLVEKVVDRADVCPKPQSVNPIGNTQR
jgi:hypothetical protein